MYLKENYDVQEKVVEKYKIEAEERAKQSSEREKIATKVEREAEDIKKAEYMESRIGEEYEGIVSSIKIILPKANIECWPVFRRRYTADMSNVYSIGIWNIHTTRCSVIIKPNLFLSLRDRFRNRIGRGII